VKIISGKRMCSILEKLEWTLARINGTTFIATPGQDGGRWFPSTATEI